MFVGAESVLDVGFDAARGRLAGLLRGGWLRRVSDEAYGELNRRLARVGPLGSTPGVSRLVEVRFGDLVTRGDTAVMPLRWEVAGSGGGLFPVLDADITLSRRGGSATLLALVGSYRPPLGGVGAALDRVVLRRVAVATIRGFLREMAEAIVNANVDARVEEQESRPEW